MILRERIAYRVPLAGAGMISLTLLAVLPGFIRGQAPAVDNPSTEAAPNVPGRIAKPNATVDRGLVGLSDEVIVLSRETSEPATNPAAAAPAATEPAHATPAAEENAPAGPQPKAPGGAPPIVGAGGEAPGVGLPSGGVAAGVPQAPGDPHRGGEEQRIAQLEARLAQLLELLERRGIPEVNGLRAPDGPGTPGLMKDGTMMGRPGGVANNMTGGRRSVTVSTPAGDKMVGLWDAIVSTGPAAETVVETLTRARYKLPAGTAQPTEDFIRQYVTADVEASAGGETGEMLTVIASQDDQARVAGFIELLRQRDDDHRPSLENKTGAKQ